MLLKYFTDDLKVSSVTLFANPELDDYFHFIEFRNDGKVVIADGGCQMVYGVIKGEF